MTADLYEKNPHQQLVKIYVKTNSICETISHLAVDLSCTLCECKEDLLLTFCRAGNSVDVRGRVLLCD